MKYLLFLLFLPIFSCAQIRIPGLARVIVGGHNGGQTVAVDTSAEVLMFSPVMTNNFDATRPNKKVVVTGTLFFSEVNINPGYSGTVLFVNPTGFAVTVNGSGTIPSSTFTATYSYSGGTLWQ